MFDLGKENEQPYIVFDLEENREQTTICGRTRFWALRQRCSIGIQLFC